MKRLDEAINKKRVAVTTRKKYIFLVANQYFNMSFTERARKRIGYEDRWTCQAPECVGVECEGHPRQFFSNGTRIYKDDSLVVNGDWNMQASHTARRDYRGRDPHMFNPDGTRRGEMLCTLDHLDYELNVLEDENAARLLALNQTIITYSGLLLNGGVDDDIPHGFFLHQETVEINNKRREKLKQQLIRIGGRMLAAD